MIKSILKRLLLVFIIIFILLIAFCYKNKLITVQYFGYEDSANLTLKELRILAKQVKKYENIKRMENNILPNNYDFDLERYYDGIVKDIHNRISYYHYGILMKSGIYKISGFQGSENLEYVLIDKEGYLKKNYFIQDYIIKGSDGVKRSYYVGEDYNVVKDVDILFNSETLSNKVILHRKDIYHFGKNMYLTKRIQLNDSDKGVDCIDIKGKWQEDKKGELQYLNPNGYIAKESMVSYIKNKKKYMCYVNEDGYIVKNYYLQEFDTGNGSHDYYFDSDGFMGMSDGIKTYVIIDSKTQSNKVVNGEYKLRISSYGHVVEKIYLNN